MNSEAQRPKTEARKVESWVGYWTASSLSTSWSAVSSPSGVRSGAIDPAERFACILQATDGFSISGTKGTGRVPAYPAGCSTKGELGRDNNLKNLDQLNLNSQLNNLTVSSQPKKLEIILPLCL